MDKLNVKRATLAEHGTIIYDLLPFITIFISIYGRVLGSNIFLNLYRWLKEPSFRQI